MIVNLQNDFENATSMDPVQGPATASTSRLSSQQYLYEATLDTLQTSQKEITRAIKLANRTLKLINTHLEEMREAAHELPDGRKVFMTRDRSAAYDEQGRPLTEEEKDLIDWDPAAPSWEKREETLSSKKNVLDQYKILQKHYGRLNEFNNEMEGQNLSPKLLHKFRHEARLMKVEANAIEQNQLAPTWEEMQAELAKRDMVLNQHTQLRENYQNVIDLKSELKKAMQATEPLHHHQHDLPKPSPTQEFNPIAVKPGLKPAFAFNQASTGAEPEPLPENREEHPSLDGPKPS